MKQRSTQQAPRLQFTRDEQSDPVMKKPIRRAQRAADARDAAQAKLPTRKRLTVQDVPEAIPTPLYKRVHLTDEVKTPARAHHAITDSASMIVHERIREDEDENTAVQAVHEAEKASEAVSALWSRFTISHRCGRIRKRRVPKSGWIARM